MNVLSKTMKIVIQYSDIFLVAPQLFFFVVVHYLDAWLFKCIENFTVMIQATGWQSCLFILLWL